MSDISVSSLRTVHRPAGRGHQVDMSEPRRRLTDAERLRRLAVLDTLREAAELRARLRPRSSQLARARALLHARTTRG